MPNIKSAKKRVLVINRRREENRYVKSTMATMIKKFRATVNTDVVKAEGMLRDIISYIDSAKSKGVIHANNASRKVSRLNLMLNKAKANMPKETPVLDTKVETPVADTKVEKKTRTTKKTAKEEVKEEAKEEAKEEKKTKTKKTTKKAE